jgi:hypothetical protein
LYTAYVVRAEHDWKVHLYSSNMVFDVVYEHCDGLYDIHRTCRSSPQIANAHETKGSLVSSLLPRVLVSSSIVGALLHH